MSYTHQNTTALQLPKAPAPAAPKAKIKRILDALSQAPGTSLEIAAELQIDAHVCAALLSKLYIWGAITRARGPVVGRGRQPFIYQLKPAAKP